MRKTQVSDGMRATLQAARAYPQLSAHEEGDLARRWQQEGDRRAVDRLVGAHLLFAAGIAGRHSAYGVDVDDLIGAANVGLMLAAARFDPERGFRFNTFARWWITAEVQRHVLDNWSSVRIATKACHRTLFFGLRRTIQALQGMDGDLPEDWARRAAAMLDRPSAPCRTQDVEAMHHRLAGGDRSLNVPVSPEEDAPEWQDILADGSAQPDEVLEEGERRRDQAVRIRRALAAMTPRDRDVVLARQLTDKAEILEDVGRRHGVSKERVRQIEVKAVETLTRKARNAAGWQAIGTPVPRMPQTGAAT